MRFFWSWRPWAFRKNPGFSPNETVTFRCLIPDDICNFPPLNYLHYLHYSPASQLKVNKRNILANVLYEWMTFYHNSDNTRHNGTCDSLFWLENAKSHHSQCFRSPKGANLILQDFYLRFPSCTLSNYPAAISLPYLDCPLSVECFFKLIIIGRTFISTVILISDASQTATESSVC